LNGICGRYTNTLGPEELGKQLGQRFGVQIRERTDGDPYNIAPTEHVLAIIAPKGQPQARLLRWGLVPAWAHDLKSGPLMINARIESVRSNAAYLEPLLRCPKTASQLRILRYRGARKPGTPSQNPSPPTSDSAAGLKSP
jgi:SOS response associated peptidase (SRAP)